jgi:DNA ligase-1
MVKKLQTNKINETSNLKSKQDPLEKKKITKKESFKKESVNSVSKRQTRHKEAKNDKIDNILDEADYTHNGKKLSSPMLASTYDGSQDINGWYMSEKLDGVRCIWNGNSLFSRNGNKFYPPDFFIEKFPKNLMLDGELFMDRNSFQDTVSIVKKQDQNDGWKKIKFLVFDGPEIKGKFIRRLEVLERELKNCSSPFLELHKLGICKGDEDLKEKMKEITSMKGEGVILRDPNSLYENRRTKTMLKVKEFHDAEAIVIAIHKGTGRLENLMGAIECVKNDGIVFRIGTGFSDNERRHPPKIGTVVTFRYFELTKDNVPRFPSFIRIHPGL